MSVKFGGRVSFDMVGMVSLKPELATRPGGLPVYRNRFGVSGLAATDGHDQRSIVFVEYGCDSSYEVVVERGTYPWMANWYALILAVTWWIKECERREDFVPVDEIPTNLTLTASS